MQQLLSEPKVRTYSNPGTLYSGGSYTSPGPIISAPLIGGGGGYKSPGMGMAPPTHIGHMMAPGPGPIMSGGYPPQGPAYGMVNQLDNFYLTIISEMNNIYIIGFIFNKNLSLVRK